MRLDRVDKGYSQSITIDKQSFTFTTRFGAKLDDGDDVDDCAKELFSKCRNHVKRDIKENREEILEIIKNANKGVVS